MSFRKHQGGEDLVSFVVNTAREQGISISPETEAHIVYHCGEVRGEPVLRSAHDVAVVAAALIAGGHQMAQELRHRSVTPYDVDGGYWTVLRSQMETPDTDMTCIDIFTCRQTTILAREDELKRQLAPFRNLLGAIGEL